VNTVAVVEDTLADPVGTVTGVVANPVGTVTGVLPKLGR
jgi:hypothetical protein